MNRSTRRTAAVLAVCAAFALSACTSQKAENTAEVSTEGLATATTMTEQWSSPPDPNLEVQALPELPAGTELVFIKCGVPSCVPYLEGITEAAEAANLQLTVLDAGNTPESQTRAWDQAVAAKPSAVLAVGFQLSLFQKQLSALEAAGIPVVTSGDVGSDIPFNVQPPEMFRQIGTIAANFVISDSDGTADALFVSTDEIPLLGFVKEGFDSTIEENCPACTLDHLNIQLANIGSTVPSQIVSYLQKHPNTTSLYLSFGDIAAGLPEALNGAGITGINISSGAGSKINYAYIEAGTQRMNMATGSDLTGWQMVDVAARMIAGDDNPPIWPLKQQIITKDTADFDPDRMWVPVPDFKEQFREGWATE